MKYKHLPAFAHNFNHSFMTDANFFGEGHALDELREAARRNPGMPLVIRWLPPGMDQPVWYTERIEQAIANWRAGLPRHAANNRIDLRHVLEMRTEITRLDSGQIVCESVLIDDRGKEYRQWIAF